MKTENGEIFRHLDHLLPESVSPTQSDASLFRILSPRKDPPDRHLRNRLSVQHLARKDAFVSDISLDLHSVSDYSNFCADRCSHVTSQSRDHHSGFFPPFFPHIFSLHECALQQNSSSLLLVQMHIELWIPARGKEFNICKTPLAASHRRRISFLTRLSVAVSG